MGKLSYIKQLDGFRGVVAILIVLYHWPMDRLSISIGGELLQWFYVMSGYLITRILVYDKSKGPKFGDFLGRFYYRRSFRIFPLYFAFMLFWTVVYFISYNVHPIHKYVSEIGDNWGYLYTYTYNFMGIGNWLLGRGYETSPIFGHLWSLSLEEQFYIVFPFVVYFLSKRNLMIVIILTIISGPIFRGIGYEIFSSINSDQHWAAVNTYRIAFSQMDSFAIGALFALTGFRRITKPVKGLAGILILMFALYAFNRWLVAYQGSSFSSVGGHRKLEDWFFYNYQHIYIFTIINFSGAFFFMCFERGYNIPWLLNNKFMVYLGKISYGIYVYHVPVLLFWLLTYKKLMSKEMMHRMPFVYELIAFIGFWILLLGISHLSFKYFESYFMRWKDRLDARKYANLRGN